MVSRPGKVIGEHGIKPHAFRQRQEMAFHHAAGTGHIGSAGKVVGNREEQDAVSGKPVLESALIHIPGDENAAEFPVHRKQTGVFLRSIFGMRLSIFGSGLSGRGCPGGSFPGFLRQGLKAGEGPGFGPVRPSSRGRENMHGLPSFTGNADGVVAKITLCKAVNLRGIPVEGYYVPVKNCSGIARSGFFGDDAAVSGYHLAFL
jgi:hypothetical protein